MVAASWFTESRVPCRCRCRCGCRCRCRRHLEPGVRLNLIRQLLLQFLEHFTPLPSPLTLTLLKTCFRLHQLPLPARPPLLHQGALLHQLPCLQWYPVKFTSWDSRACTRLVQGWPDHQEQHQLCTRAGQVLHQPPVRSASGPVTFGHRSAGHVDCRGAPAGEVASLPTSPGWCMVHGRLVSGVWCLVFDV